MDNTREVLDELDRINSCNMALSYLMCPDNDCIDRDKTSVLMSYLTEQQAKLLDQLRALKCQSRLSNQG